MSVLIGGCENPRCNSYCLLFSRAAAHHRGGDRRVAREEEKGGGGGMPDMGGMDDMM